MSVWSAGHAEYLHVTPKPYMRTKQYTECVNLLKSFADSRDLLRSLFFLYVKERLDVSALVSCGQG